MPKIQLEKTVKLSDFIAIFALIIAVLGFLNTREQLSVTRKSVSDELSNWENVFLRIQKMHLKR